MKIRALSTALTALVFLSGASLLGAAVYNESGGLVVMEMENTESPLGLWQAQSALSGYTGSGYLQFLGNTFETGPATSPLEYTFKINQAGLYYLHMHCAKETHDGRTDVANDCYVRVVGDYNAGPGPHDSHGDNASLSLLQSNTKYFGGATDSWKWEDGEASSGGNGNLDPGGHANKRVAVYDFKAGETYTLVVSGRSKFFRINRLMFRHTSVSKSAAQNLSNPESGLVTSTPEYTYDATEDFPSYLSGDVPYYIDNGNDALAIDASNVSYRDRFARASRTFDGASGTYDVTITTLTEEDGESTYRLLVNGSIVGTFENTHIGAGSPLDMQPETHTWSGIAISNGDTLAIESNTDTNGEIPEGDGTAWARGRWRQIELSTSAALIKPPVGRLAIVADGNSPDPDDIGATAVMFGILSGAGLQDRVVHLSHSCDLVKASNISAADELRRQRVLHQLCADGISYFGPLSSLADYYNCRSNQTAAVNDLRDAINASSASDPLWIIEAGEPDIIGYALEAATASKRQYVHVVSHHPANDNSGDYFTWAEILAFGVTEHQIGDQNVGLQVLISSGLWDWAENHTNPGIAWIWDRLKYAEQDGVVGFQTGKFDCSDAGMIYWWITGANAGGNRNSTPVEIRNMLLHVSGESDEPIAHWRLDEGTGTVANDASGRGFTGTLLNGASWGSDATRSSHVAFDGTDDRISTLFTYALSASDNFTWAWWAKRAITNDFGAIMVGNRYPQPGPGGQTYEFIKFTPSKAQFADAADVAGIHFFDYADIDTNGWHHYAMTKSGTSYQWYVDGVAVGSPQTFTYSEDSALPFLIGGDDDGSGTKVNEHFEGGIDDVVLYNRALSPSEVANVRDGIYNRGQAVTNLMLINADTDQDIGPIRAGDTLYFDLLPTTNLSVRADTTPDVASVRFAYDGNTNYQTESVEPFALAGDAAGDYNPWTPSLGAHTLTATPFSEAGAGGTAGTPLTINFNVLAEGGTGSAISGELRKWHKVTLTWNGPSSSETAATNPFSDYRLNVTFSHAGSGKSYIVPGYFAADGDAAESGADAGDKWRAHFAPDEVGQWSYTVSFRAGSDIAIDSAAGAGTAAGFFDGDSGGFAVAATDKTGRDLRGKGRLRYVGKHHLQFAETGEYFLKAGADAPENFLAYDDFDATTNDQDNQPDLRKSWSPHAGDYHAATAEPFTWQGGKGTEILGAVRYLSQKGLNVFSFLTFSLDGDDDNVFPHRLKSTVAAYEAVADNARWAHANGVYHDRFDVSKMAQWERVFEYGDLMGMYLHFKTQETENDQRMDGGALGRERKLYYRELVARFSHHLALNWNLGEENTNTEAQRRAFAQWFHDNDPYRHNVVLHTYPNAKSTVYTPLLGTASKLTGLSLQTNQEDFSNVFPDTLTWVRNSAGAGVPWVAACDEPGDASHALRPVGDEGNSWIDGRKNALWGNVMAGGAGVEFYFGYQHANSDLTCQDFRSRDGFWDTCRYMLEFFTLNQVPFQDMVNTNGLVSGSGDNANRCLAKTGESYVVQLYDGGSHTLDLSAAPAETFNVRWFDPRNGGALQSGSITGVLGGSTVSLGEAPSSTTSDWVVLVQFPGTNTPPTVTSVTNNTAGTVSWTCPPGVTSVRVECWGGGGAGGAADAVGTANVGGGGGSGGAYARKADVPVTPGDSYAMTIPAAATAPAGTSDGARFDGATVSFSGDSGVSVTAAGGQGGECRVGSGNISGTGGVGSTVGCDGDAVFAGGNGAQNGDRSGGGGGGGAGDTNPGGNANAVTAGSGGVDGGGDGGGGRNGHSNGRPGQVPGGGGGGAKSQSGVDGAAKSGGTGGLGQIVITYTLPPTVESPVLEHSMDGGDMGFSWSEDGYKLQTRTNLLIGAWADYPGGSSSPVNVTPTNVAAFFRLIQK